MRNKPVCVVGNVKFASDRNHILTHGPSSGAENSGALKHLNQWLN